MSGAVQHRRSQIVQ